MPEEDPPSIALNAREFSAQQHIDAVLAQPCGHDSRGIAILAPEQLLA
jgi:hypothetical protein